MYDISKHKKKIYPISIPISRPYHTINILKTAPQIEPVKLTSLPPTVEIWQSPKKALSETPKPYLGSKKSYDCKKTYWGSKKKYNHKKTYWGSKRVAYKSYHGSKKMVHRKQCWGSKRNLGGSKYKKMYKPCGSKQRIGYRRTKKENDYKKWNKKDHDEKNTFVPQIITIVKNRKKN